MAPMCTLEYSTLENQVARGPAKKKYTLSSCMPGMATAPFEPRPDGTALADSGSSSDEDEEYWRRHVLPYISRENGRWRRVYPGDEDELDEVPRRIPECQDGVPVENMQAPPASVDEAIVVAQGLLNTVHLVRGTIASLGGLDGLEWTNWAVVKVPAERRFLLRTYSDLAWRDVDLSKIDFAKAHAPRPLYDGLGTHRSFLPPALVTQ